MTRRQFVSAFGSGVVCAFAIIALVHLADLAIARRLSVAESRSLPAAIDWRAVPLAHAVRIPAGPPPEIEVRVGAIAENQRIPRSDHGPMWKEQRTFAVHRLVTDYGDIGMRYVDGNGLSGQCALFRFGPGLWDLHARAEDFYDVGPPSEFVWSHVVGNVQVSEWPLVPGRTEIAFDLVGRRDEAPRFLSGAFVVPQ
jgi:hypothetical protein